MLLFSSKIYISFPNANKMPTGRSQAMDVFEYVKDFTALAILFTAAYLWMMVL